MRTTFKHMTFASNLIRKIFEYVRKHFFWNLITLYFKNRLIHIGMNAIKLLINKKKNCRVIFSMNCAAHNHFELEWEIESRIVEQSYDIPISIVESRWKSQFHCFSCHIDPIILVLLCTHKTFIHYWDTEYQRKSSYFNKRFHNSRNPLQSDLIQLKNGIAFDS